MTNGIDQRLLSILGPHQFFSPEDWLTFYGIKIKDAKLPIPLKELEEIMNSPCPFFPEQKVKETHFLMFIPGRINKKGKRLSIRILQKFFPKNQTPRFWNYLADNLADNNQPYADEKIEKNTWVLVLKEVIPHSRQETYAEQLTMLPSGYIIPTAVVITTFLFSIYQKSKGEKIMEFDFGRTNSLAYGGRRVYVGSINQNELFICTEEDDERNSDLGVYAIREL